MSICKNCGKECITHAKNMCTTCYKKLVWKPKIKECKRCKRLLPLHARGYCGGCYNYLFHLDYTKDKNYRKYHGINIETYRKITPKCIICGFDKAVELHHLDSNHKNNSESNLVGLCPNHHKMAHLLKYKQDIKGEIDKAINKETTKTP